MIPLDENVTVLKIVFEVVSAFGTVFYFPSKIVLLLTMLIGRHRDLLDSMKEQEKIEYNAHALLERWRQMARDEHPVKDISIV
jgi:hypothetical protein